MAIDRIVSLLPSSTEIVCALGFRDKLVGRSHECDYPPGVEELPVCTEPKVDLSGTSYQIDQKVKAVLEQATAVYRVFPDVLDKVRPDVVVTQSQCDVCAVSMKEVEEAVCTLVGSRPQLVSLEPNSLGDIWQDFRKVARALNVPERGEHLVGHCKGRMEQIAQRAAKLQTRPRVATIEWIEPPMAGGNWMPTLVEMAGAENLFGKAGEHSPWLEWQDLMEADPDYIFILPCGFGIARTEAEMAALVARKGWNQLRAVRHGRVYLTDGHHYFNRPGPRVVESLEILAEILHPETFDFGHQGIGWKRWSR